MNIAGVMMQRNEDLCLEPWLRYHGALFGDKNLFVLDHQSDDASVLAALAAAAARGVHVMRLPPGADYRRKGEFVSYAMRQAEAGYDFVLPLDCDEFVVIRLPWGEPCCRPGEILDYFETLPASGLAFGVGKNFLNMLGRPSTFFALPYQKVWGCPRSELDLGRSHACEWLSFNGQTAGSLGRVFRRGRDGSDGRRFAGREPQDGGLFLSQIARDHRP